MTCRVRSPVLSARPAVVGRVGAAVRSTFAAPVLGTCVTGGTVVAAAVVVVVVVVGQASVEQSLCCRWPAAKSHSTPPSATSTSTINERRCEPPPHDTGHSLQSDQYPTQSTGHGIRKHLLGATSPSRDGQSTPPFEAAVTTSKVWNCRPVPHDTEHCVKFDQLPSQGATATSASNVSTSKWTQQVACVGHRARPAGESAVDAQDTLCESCLASHEEKRCKTYPALRNQLQSRIPVLRAFDSAEDSCCTCPGQRSRQRQQRHCEGRMALSRSGERRSRCTRT